jgi:hypothetical protein
MIARWTVLTMLVLAVGFAQAQPMGDKAPADALIYVGWQGADHLPAGYQQTRLKALLDSSKIPELLNTALPALVARVAQDDKQAAEGLAMFFSMAGPMWHHPTAFYSSGVEFGGGMPVPRFAILCQAGKDADAMAQQLDAFLAKANVQQAPFPVKSYKQGDVVGLIVGYANDVAAIAGDASKSLIATDRFKSAISQVQKEPLCVVYVDAEGVLAQIDQANQMFAPPQEQQRWQLMKNASNIGGIKRFILTRGYDAQDWGTQCFIAAPGPRSGIPALLDSAPMSDEMLKAIPATATVAGVAHFNLGRFFNEIRDAAGKVNPQAQQQLDQVMGMAQMALAINLQKDLFESLGAEWAFYLDPDSGGRGLLGATIVNHLAKPDDANRALKKLELALDNGINGQIPPQEKVRINFETFTTGDLTIHYVALPFVSPSWAIRGNYLFAGLYPQTVAAASENAKGKSILDNPQFVSLRARLGGEKAGSFSYFDLPRTVDDNYQLLQAGVQGLTGMADMFGIKTPPMVLPSLKAFKANLTAAASFAWSDDAGWHSKGVSPVPGGELLGSQGGILMAAPLLAGITMPAMYKARAAAGAQVIMNNLRQIGMGAMMYANDNKGKYPPDLGTMMLSEDLQVDAFVNPQGGTQIPPNIRQGKREDQAAWVNEHSDFVWLGATMKPGDGADQVLAYEKPELARNGMVGLLFNDGHVEMRQAGQAMQVVQQQGRGK